LRPFRRRTLRRRWRGWRRRRSRRPFSFPPRAYGGNRVTGTQVRDYTDYTAVIVKLEKPALFKVNTTKDGRLVLVIGDCTVARGAANWINRWAS